MHTFCIALIDGKYYLKAYKENDTMYISGTLDTPEEACAKVMDLYSRKLHSGYEQYASACIHSLFFQYSFFSLRDDEILNLFPNKENINAVNVSHVSGFFTGYEIQDVEFGKKLFDNGFQSHLPVNQG